MADAGDARAARYPVSPTMIMILQGRSLEARVEESLKGIGLSLRKLGLLGHLRQEPGISFSALARRAGIKVQSLHPIVESLVSAGHVATVGGTGQGRAAVIELTDRGASMLEQATRLIAEHDHEVFAKGEWKDLGTALTRLGEALWRERTQPSPPGGG
ncbi:MarR family winged helix-turn-helix transcriptional regulator [Streptomyces fuscigenes]|uniref:MarR family winged helix-turn-helix transcriptional regulator n=1 Tax=Streptomyces fuscigenes TaxID=1528880 RepID=UPI001F1D26F3|nr:MarR family winged helix-turn-helix transcriptional regulator [Streptomyces fuscigenes]MCF3961476.1 MarR family winged helix-turn-helix transcriptional regulator [Streptomyces fuscigenes]